VATYRTGSSYDSASTTVSSYSQTIPGTVQAGDFGVLLVTWVGTSGETPPTCTATGWTQAVVPTTANNMGYCVLTRAYQSGDGSSVTVTLGSARYVTAVAGWWSGTNGLDVVGPLYSRGGTSLSTTQAQSTTATNAGSTVVCVWSERTTATGTTYSVDTGTSRLFYEGTGNATDSAALSDFVAATTTTGLVTATYNSAGGNGAGAQLVLLPSSISYSHSTADSAGAGDATPGTKSAVTSVSTAGHLSGARIGSKVGASGVGTVGHPSGARSGIRLSGSASATAAAVRASIGAVRSAVGSAWSVFRPSDANSRSQGYQPVNPPVVVYPAPAVGTETVTCPFRLGGDVPVVTVQLGWVLSVT